MSILCCDCSAVLPSTVTQGNDEVIFTCCCSSDVELLLLRTDKIAANTNTVSLRQPTYCVTNESITPSHRFNLLTLDHKPILPMQSRGPLLPMLRETQSMSLTSVLPYPTCKRSSLKTTVNRWHPLQGHPLCPHRNPDYAWNDSGLNRLLTCPPAAYSH
jgi:hypothetical protein